jgi:hypothetical protein
VPKLGSGSGVGLVVWFSGYLFFFMMLTGFIFVAGKLMVVGIKLRVKSSRQEGRYLLVVKTIS